MANAMKLLETYSATGKKQKDPQKTDQAPTGIKSNNATTKEETTGIQFAQTGKAAVAGANGKLHETITCLKCKQKGHYASSCPEKQEVQFFQTVVEDVDDST